MAAGTYRSMSELVGNESYRLRVRACILEESITKSGGFDPIYANIHNITEKAVNRFAPLHVADYESGKATGLAEPSNNIPDPAIGAAVQTFWDEITVGTA